MNNEKLSTCPICHSKNISENTQKYIFGLIKLTYMKCSDCYSTFRFKDDCLELISTEKADNSTWNDYGGQILTIREWNMIENGGMSDAKQHEADRLYSYQQLRNGNINFTFIKTNTPIILKNSEKLYCAIPDVTLKEPRAVRVTHGGYAGPTFRVAKGVSFHLGRFGSSSESHQEIKDIDRGILTLTNERLIFSGAMKTINIDLDKIIQIDPFADGISLHKQGREKTQYFLWGNNVGSVKIQVDGRSYDEAFSGLVFQCFVEGLRRLDI